MSRAIDKINARLENKYVMLNEPMRFNTTIESSDMGPSGCMGQLFSIGIDWHIDAEIRIKDNAGKAMVHYIETAKRMFVEDVYGEFRNDLLELRRELMNWMNAEDAIRKVDSIYNRMFTITSKETK